MKQIPNILTFLRLIAIPFFIGILFYNTPSYRWVFLFLFFVISFTDFFDGYIARKYNIVSNIGRIFDPIADKALIILLCMIILIKDSNISLIIIFPITLMILRELIISGIREGLASQSTIIKSNFIGKSKTSFQMFALGFLMIGGDENIFYIGCLYTGVLLLYVSAILSLISGSQYLSQSYKSLREESLKEQ